MWRALSNKIWIFTSYYAISFRCRDGALSKARELGFSPLTVSLLILTRVAVSTPNCGAN
jgi:hypothetical protein